MNKSFCLTVFCFLLLLLYQTGVAQNSVTLPTEKAKIVEQLKDELVKSRGTACFLKGVNFRERSKHINDALSDLDPMLVGKHVVFGKEWLNHVGSGKPLSNRQFEVWRDRADRVYDAYTELTGRTPAGGTKVFIDLRAEKDFGVADSDSENVKHPPAHAHAGINVICFNCDAPSFRNTLQSVAAGSWDRPMMHELAHVFAFRTNWNVDAESIAEFLPSYIMETIRGANYGNGRFSFAGRRHRQSEQNRAFRNFQNAQIEAFNPNHQSPGCAYEFYLHGLVDKVGWETYKKAFRSYDDKNYVPQNEYKGDRKTVQARDFLDRLERFSGKRDVLRSLPDKGELLDKYFAVTTIAKVPPKNEPPQKTETPAIAATPPPAETQAPDTGRPYMNDLIQKLNGEQ